MVLSSDTLSQANGTLNCHHTHFLRLMIQWSSYTFSQAEGPLTFLKPMAQWSSYTLSQADGTLVIFLGAMVQLHILPQADGHRTFVKPMAQWSSYTLRPTAQWSYFLKPMAHWSSHITFSGHCTLYILPQADGRTFVRPMAQWSSYTFSQADGTMILAHSEQRFMSKTSAWSL